MATVAEVTTAPSGEVTIAGRSFRLGVVYAPAPHVRPYEQGRLLPLRLVDYDPGLPVAGRTDRGRAGPDRCRPRAAHATPPAVRPGVGGLGGRGEGSVSHRTARAWRLIGLRRGLHRGRLSQQPGRQHAHHATADPARRQARLPVNFRHEAAAENFQSLLDGLPG